MTLNKLFVIRNPNPDAKVRLFCFPFAGGGINTYFSWLNFFPEDAELVFVQPPGRGTRIFESAHQSMAALMKELMHHADFIVEKPYVLFGHSLGSRVAYELCCQLMAANKHLPECVIASGSRAPHTKGLVKSIHDMPEDEFLNELKNHNGTPSEVLENKGLMELLLPLLRADFRISETYLAEPIVLNIPFEIFHGEQDISVEEKNVFAWRELSSKNTNITRFNGDHFFINHCSDKVASKILEIIQRRV
ncbi:thioesterase II family protein [Rheinheimera oceanensis]|uniref:thioesterase II family protein n=1 Tax=Rheinheimera oceanensis TaxID=2817449 RepID=UPI001BFD231D|nr:thioesterase domain-containing protein [Rheinheimera oceanensis]